MAGLNNVYLIQPFLAVQTYNVTDITFNVTNLAQGYVRQTYGYACLAAEGDKIVYNSQGQLAVNQSGNHWNIIDEKNIILIYRIADPIPLP